MKPLNLEITDVLFRRPGLNKVSFLATYQGYFRRGTVTYDTVNKQFVTHTKDVELLAHLCNQLQRPRHSKAD